MKRYLVKKANRLKRNTYALYLAYKDPRVPWYAKIFIAGIVGYVLSPFDLVPEFIPVIGYLDDIVILSVGIYISLRMIPEEVWRECKEKATNEPLDKKLGVIAGIIVFFIWIFIIWALFKKFLNPVFLKEKF